jgi:hypothetical protein
MDREGFKFDLETQVVPLNCLDEFNPDCPYVVVAYRRHNLCIALTNTTTSRSQKVDHHSS